MQSLRPVVNLMKERIKPYRAISHRTISPSAPRRTDIQVGGFWSHPKKTKRVLRDKSAQTRRREILQALLHPVPRHSTILRYFSPVHKVAETEIHWTMMQFDVEESLQNYEFLTLSDITRSLENHADEEILTYLADHEDVANVVREAVHKILRYVQTQFWYRGLRVQFFKGREDIEAAVLIKVYAEITSVVSQWEWSRKLSSLLTNAAEDCTKTKEDYFRMRALISVVLSEEVQKIDL